MAPLGTLERRFGRIQSDAGSGKVRELQAGAPLNFPACEGIEDEGHLLFERRIGGRRRRKICGRRGRRERLSILCPALLRRRALKGRIPHVDEEIEAAQRKEILPAEPARADIRLSDRVREAAGKLHCSVGAPAQPRNRIEEPRRINAEVKRDPPHVLDLARKAQRVSAEEEVEVGNLPGEFARS